MVKVTPYALANNARFSPPLAPPARPTLVSLSLSSLESVIVLSAAGGEVGTAAEVVLCRASQIKTLKGGKGRRGGQTRAAKIAPSPPRSPPEIVTSLEKTIF